MAQSTIKAPVNSGAYSIYLSAADGNGVVRRILAGANGAYEQYYDESSSSWKTVPLAVTAGGTGATTAAGAVANLDIGDAFITRNVTISITTAASTTESVSGTGASVSGYTPYFLQGWNMIGTASSMLMITRLNLTPSTRVVSVQVRNTSSSAANATMTVVVGYIKNTLL